MYSSKTTHPSIGSMDIPVLSHGIFIAFLTHALREFQACKHVADAGAILAAVGSNYRVNVPFDLRSNIISTLAIQPGSQNALIVKVPPALTVQLTCILSAYSAGGPGGKWRVGPLQPSGGDFRDFPFLKPVR